MILLSLLFIPSLIDNLLIQFGTFIKCIQNTVKTWNAETDPS